jgi:hypothetical protein
MRRHIRCAHPYQPTSFVLQNLHSSSTRVRQVRHQATLSSQMTISESSPSRQVWGHASEFARQIRERSARASEGGDCSDRGIATKYKA